MELDLSNFDMYLELRRSQDKAEEHEKESEELRQKVEEMKRTMLNMSLTQQDLEAQLEKLQACHVEESPMEESLVEVSLVEEHTAHETGESADHGSGDAENWSCTEAGFVFAHAHKRWTKPLTRNPGQQHEHFCTTCWDIGRSDIAYELVNNLESDKIKMLVQECDVTVAQIKGKKNVLHLCNRAAGHNAGSHDSR
nr:hypothetical protein BaRGS_024799 [Batillaria attramentaria]